MKKPIKQSSVDERLSKLEKEVNELRKLLIDNEDSARSASQRASAALWVANYGGK